MKRTVPLFFLTLALVLALSACGGAPTPGAWKVPNEGADQSGTWITFWVNDDSTAITGLDLFLPYKFACSGMPIPYDHILFAAGEDDPYEVSEILATYVHGTLGAITDGSFSVTLDALVFEQSIFEAQMAVFTFAGKFTSPKKASGTWSLALTSSDRTCSGTWNGVPIPPKAE